MPGRVLQQSVPAAVIDGIGAPERTLTYNAVKDVPNRAV
jgi:hypothetical protein